MTTMWSLSALVALMVASIHQTAVGQRVTISRTCQYDTDCEPNSYCKLQDRCECKAGYFIYTDPARSEACLAEVSGAGSICSVDEQCQLKMGSAAECTPSQGCQCRSGAHHLNGRCYNTSKVGEACLTSDNCHLDQPGVLLTCERSICVCPRRYHGNYGGTACITSIRLGDPCEKTEQCVSPHSICFEECRCDVHHTKNSNGTACLPEAERVGDACQDDVQCSTTIEYSSCSSGLCRCQQGHHPGPQGHKCWRTARLDEPCEDDNQCLPSFPWDPRIDPAMATCQGGVCKCAPVSTRDSRGYCVGNGVGAPSAGVALLLAATAVTTLATRLR